MDLLHPQLLSKQQLLDIFRQRHFTIPRLEESTRDELIQLYTKHLLPQPRRGTPGSGSSADGPQDVEMKDCSPPSNGDASRKRNNVRQRIVYGDSPAVDNVSHGMKKIRLISSSGTFATSHNSSSVVVKRSLEISPGKTATMSEAANNSSSKRQKITWP
ncbi:conserved hypothetical protein [Culex quinquefasciatus]|uniref:Uncharacterized protein n=1 Tax=Culex quinquefasciatus TaxID=7176 RepID=B0X1U2_CULQU|nr:conserved hypothetical protein [Culex quinquefasciatus]|eukprot:XP_001863614.1 conserved hypothetical protein [Culex quinquefasciatus]